MYSFVTPVSLGRLARALATILSGEYPFRESTNCRILRINDFLFNEATFAESPNEPRSICRVFGREDKCVNLEAEVGVMRGS